MANDVTSNESLTFPPVSSSNALVSPRPASSGSGKLVEEVEQRAGYYTPDVYQLLNFYTSYRTETDSNTDFLPATQVKPNPKLFVVGVLPPNVNITGRLLDRSASVSNVEGDRASDSALALAKVQREWEEKYGTWNNRTNTWDAPGDYTKVASEYLDGVAVSFQDGPKGADLPPAFWQDYVLMCKRLKVDPHDLAAVLDKESGFNPAAQNKGPNKDHVIAQGLCQFVRKTAQSRRVGMSDETWKNFALLSAQEQLVYVGRYYAGRSAGKSKDQLNLMTFGGYYNPDGSAYASRAYAEQYVADHPGTDISAFKNLDKQDAALKANPGSSRDGGQTIRPEVLAERLNGYPRQSIRARITEAQQFLARNGAPADSYQIESAGVSSNWQGIGSVNAAESQKQLSKTAEQKNLNRVNLGKTFLLAQSAEIKQTAQAVQRMRDTPPLRLLVNPISFTVSSEKIVSDGNWTRNGPVIEHWGDNQDKIEASGKVAAFFAIDSNSPGPQSLGEGPGLTRGARQYSAGYQNFLSLYLLYRNNAAIYTGGQDLASKEKQSRMSLVGTMYLFYDDTIYLGSFDSFNVTESETSPYTLEYNFQFVVRATFLLDRPTDFSSEAATFIRSQDLNAPLPTTTEPSGLEDYSSVNLPTG